MKDNYKQIINSFLKNESFYSYKYKKKENFLKCMMSLNSHHYKFCENYKKILNANKFKIVVKKKIKDEFYLPVNLFKKFK